MAVRLISPVFIGRRAEMAYLETAFATARRGEPATVLLGGEAGVGKSRLAARLRALGSLVLTGGCLELGADGLPFAPFTAVLRELTRETGAPAVVQLLGGRTGEIARLLPDLGSPGPAPGETAAAADDLYPGEGRGRLFEQMLTLLEQLAERDPVVLVIEDLHWADGSTRDLLSFLVSNQRALPGVPGCSGCRRIPRPCCGSPARRGSAPGTPCWAQSAGSVMTTWPRRSARRSARTCSSPTRTATRSGTR